MSLFHIFESWRFSAEILEWRNGVCEIVEKCYYARDVPNVKRWYLVRG